MIGQSYAPLGDPTQQRPSGMSPQGGPQQAIKILNLRMPRVQGAAAPAPAALLNSPGSGGLPQPPMMGGPQGGPSQQPTNPILDAILRAVLGGYQPPQQSAPSAPGGGVPSSPNLPVPAVHYQPPPGGTAGPNPVDPMTREDRGNTRGKTGGDFFPVR